MTDEETPQARHTIEDWLDEQIADAKRRFEEAESDSHAYQLAAEVETYVRIKNDTLPFGGPEEALRIYKDTEPAPEFRMTAARIRALERYLERCP